MSAFDVGNNIDLDKWISWPKNSFQKMLLDAIEAAKQANNEKKLDQSLTIEESAIDPDLGDLLRQISSDIARQMVKKLPFDRISYLIEYEQTLSNQNIIINNIWGSSLKAATYQWFIARDIFSYVISHHVDRRNKYRFHAIGSIITRSLLVFREIICLCSNGFPDGAMARWRTLHELSVSLASLNHIGKKSWELFIVSEQANSLRYEQSLHQEGSRRRDEIEREIAGLKSRYGKNIIDDYGWIAISLNKTRMNLRNIEDLIGYKEQRANVKHASLLIHANHLWPDQLLGNPEWDGVIGPIIGPSPYGMGIPLNEAVKTLTLISLDMLPKSFTLDTLIMLQIANLNWKKFDVEMKRSKSMLHRYTESINKDWNI